MQFLFALLPFFGGLKVCPSGCTRRKPSTRRARCATSPPPPVWQGSDLTGHVGAAASQVCA